MMYEKKKKSKLVFARQINSLADADVVLFTCPHVAIVEAWVSENPYTSFVTFITGWNDYNVYLGNYVVWTDKKFKVIDKLSFEKKYQQVPECNN